MAAPSLNELFAVLLARDLRSDDRVIQVGANLPMARAAAMLANMTTHPDARILLGLPTENLAGATAIPRALPFLFDSRGLASGEAFMFQSRVFDDMSRPDVFFLGGLEVDAVGNVNLIGIPGSGSSWKVRGPGAVALATMSTYSRGYYIVMPRHDARTFVERVACITALGDRDRRRELGFPGGGPRLVLSPLGVFDFDGRGRMRIKSLHEGVAMRQVAEATGFALVVPAGGPPTSSPPTAAELAVLRGRVDPEGGLLRTEP